MAKLPENTDFEWSIGTLVTLELGSQKYALLQKRPQIKPDSTPESFPGCLQVTFHGKLEKRESEKRESFVSGLKREIQEEIIEMLWRCRIPLTKQEKTALGYFVSANIATDKDALKFYELLFPDYFGEQKGVIVSSRKTVKTKRKTDITTQFDIPENLLEQHPELTWVINKLKESHVIVLLSSSDLDNLIPLDPKLHKQNGVQEAGKFGMFQDEIDAVKKALM